MSAARVSSFEGVSRSYEKKICNPILRKKMPSNSLEKR